MRTQTSGECLRREEQPPLHPSWPHNHEEDADLPPLAATGYSKQNHPKKDDLKERRDMNTTTLNPGSDAAIKQGCDCPVLDNGHGRGIGGNGEKHGWWITEGCPLHGKKEAK